MTLAWRILLIALLLNVLTVGSVQIVVHEAQQQWFDNERKLLTSSVNESFEELARVYSAKALNDAASNGAVVRRLLRNQSLADLYDDVIVTSGRPPFDNSVYLNTLGAVHRDPDTFDLTEIVAGIGRARSIDRVFPVGSGFCRALRQNDRVVGYLWFVPKDFPQLPVALPVWTAFLGIFGSTILFGVVLIWLTRRTVARPMEAIREAAQAVAAGHYDARLPDNHSVPELQQLVVTFNRMAEQVQNHTATLQEGVRKAVDETEQKERALVQSSRLATIGTLAAGVAHEINNPIGGMQNAINRLLQAEALSDKQTVYLNLVKDGLSRVARTTRRMLGFAPKDAESAVFDVGTAIAGAYALVEHRCHQNNVSFAVVAPTGDELPCVYGDAHEIQQVMLNLFLNSLDAMHGSAGNITVTCSALDHMVRVVVQDDGPGMPQELLARVFDPFFSQKDRPDASGLGMFISYSIVQNHGGTMTIDSSEGAGFRATIELPVAPPEAGESVSAAAGAGG
ncbi:MAG TPA: HAMP domain-containing histidine kinase [Planctomycetes bacterium]|nr:HAMP domain-containing histidine kinase [Planctomycetota bacterium]